MLFVVISYSVVLHALYYYNGQICQMLKVKLYDPSGG